MACDTFIKIAQKCRRHFIQVQVGEVMPFIDEILNNINTIICDLQPQQVRRTGTMFSISWFYRLSLCLLVSPPQTRPTFILLTFSFVSRCTPSMKQ